jgi:hypothetical protein
MKELFWVFLQSLFLVIFFGSFPLGTLFDRPGTGLLVFLSILLLHTLELLVTIPLAIEKTYPVGKMVSKTMLFGFAWWVPFKQGLFEPNKRDKQIK